MPRRPAPRARPPTHARARAQGQPHDHFSPFHAPAAPQQPAGPIAVPPVRAARDYHLNRQAAEPHGPLFGSALAAAPYVRHKEHQDHYEEQLTAEYDADDADAAWLTGVNAKGGGGGGGGGGGVGQQSGFLAAALGLYHQVSMRISGSGALEEVRACVCWRAQGACVRRGEPGLQWGLLHGPVCSRESLTLSCCCGARPALCPPTRQQHQPQQQAAAAAAAGPAAAAQQQQQQPPGPRLALDDFERAVDVLELRHFEAVRSWWDREQHLGEFAVRAGGSGICRRRCFGAA
jgi:hypothetical protein